MPKIEALPSRTCPYCGETVEERMDFINQMAESCGIKKAWFSDQAHFICYNASYAFDIMGDSNSG